MPAAGKYHLLAVIALGGGAAAVTATTADRVLGQPGMPAGAIIKDAEGHAVGSLRVQDEGRHKARITVNAKGLPPGYHGLHIHEKGLCDPRSIDPMTGSPFFSAGPHFDLGAHQHPQHAGDLPNLLIAKDGTGHATVVTDRFRLRQLLDGDGRAVIIHAMPDNQANIPPRYTTNGKPGPDPETHKTGDSSTRLACGVITKR